MKSKTYVDDLKNKTAADLAQELTAAKKELFNLRFQNATNQLDNTAPDSDDTESQGCRVISRKE